MNPWRWYRARRTWIQVAVAVVLIPFVAALLYTAGRSIQYAAAERDTAPYVPGTANVVVCARDLSHHVARIQESAAWRVLQKKFLKDPVLRREINGLLKSGGVPTLDDLDDERKPYARNLPRVIDAVGLDLIASLQVKSSLSQAPFCLIVRLRWLHYLAAPLARLVLPVESIGGEKALVLRMDQGQIYVATAGALAIASNDRALLEQALRRKGGGEGLDRPLEARVVFEGSPGLLQIRKLIDDSGIFPYVKWDTARGISMAGDLTESVLKVDATFDRAEPIHAAAPPLVARSWAPIGTSGVMVVNTGAGDLIEWLRRSSSTAGPNDFAARTAREALQALDEGGLTRALLPLLLDGLGLVTGIEDREGRAYTTFALILPSRDPQAAVEAMNELIKKIAGSWAESALFEPIQVGSVTGFSWRWPNSLQMNDLLRPTYAAVKGTFVLGNNRAFTEAVLRAAEQADGLEETSSFRRFRARLKEEGFTADPPIAGGFLYPPVFRESLDGSLFHLAKQMVYATINGPTLRAEVIADLRRSGGSPTDKEILDAYNAAIDRKIQDREAALRRLIQPMDAIKWGAFEASTVRTGIAVRAAIEFR